MIPSLYVDLVRVALFLLNPHHTHRESTSRTQENLESGRQGQREGL